MQASARLSSPAASRRVIADVSGVITRSCYRTCRGKANVAALSGQVPPKGQKRISKNERRVQIIEFVDIYKRSNDGKFPTTTMVRQHVGGSHYTVREILQEVIYNHAKLPLDKSQAAQPHESTESAEGLRPDEDNVSNSFNPKSFNGEQDIDDTLLSHKDSATGTVTIGKTGAWRSLELKTPPDSSHCNGETKTSKQVLYTEDILKNGNDSYVYVSGQAEVQGIKTAASISLGAVTKSDPGSHQGETEANKLHLTNMENFQNASEPTVSADRKQDVDDVSQRDSATSTTGTWRPLTPDSSHYTSETEAAKQVSYTADISKNANESTVSGQTETESMKIEASISLGVVTKSDPGSHQGETEANKLHLTNTENFQNASEPTVSADRKQDVDDVSQRDSATSTTGIWRSLTPDSSHYTGETEAAKQVSYTADISKNANESTVSGQTETESMKTEASMSLGLATKSEPGNHHEETEASKLHLNNVEKFQNASEPTVSSYQTKSDEVKANAVHREEKGEVEHDGSTKTSLLGTLKSFAYGIRNFWKKL